MIIEVENDSKVRAVIITGGGEKCFSAGFDVSDASNVSKTSPKARELWRRIDCLYNHVSNYLKNNIF